MSCRSTCGVGSGIFDLWRCRGLLRIWIAGFGDGCGALWPSSGLTTPIPSIKIFPVGCKRRSGSVVAVSRRGSCSVARCESVEV